MVYANADVTKAEQAKEVLAFAGYWHRVSGRDPGLLVFDSQLTNYATLDELCGRGVSFLTLRQLESASSSDSQHSQLRRGLPITWVAPPLSPPPDPRGDDRSERGRPLAPTYRHPQHRHDQPTLLVTNELTTAVKDLSGRYAERMMIENELDADISGFDLNALSSGLPLNVDVDRTLTVLAGNCYRLLARKLPRYELATADRIWRHLLDDTGTVTVAEDHVRVERSCAPTRRCSSMPAFPISTSRSRGGEAGSSAPASRRAEPQLNY